jgi:hypothetical protein
LADGQERRAFRRAMPSFDSRAAPEFALKEPIVA